MSEPLHVIYRHEPTSDGEPTWHSYSYPTAVYASGYALEDLREAFREAVAFHYGETPVPQLVEHLEHQAAPGVFLRVAVDRQTLDRDYVESTMRAALTRESVHRPRFAAEQVSASGDIVVVCAVASDRLGWVFEQMGEHDALHIAMAVSDFGVNIATVAGPSGIPDPTGSLTLNEVGLSSESTIGEFMVAVTPDRESSRLPVLITL